ncbi:MAG TPA: hypothetical protein VK629_03090 [Steroidobacteraceae bacterium]|nr:hypothetical protein [Steroidobacteraceae bacterium]
MSELDDTVERMQACLSLQDVFIRKASAELLSGFDAKHSSEPLSIQLKFNPHGEAESILLKSAGDGVEESRLLRYAIETGVRFLAEKVGESKKQEVRAEILATFVVDYFVTDDSCLSDNSVAKFAENVIYHVWPYWREFVQTSANRLRLPPAVLPPYKLRRKKSLHLSETSKT